MIYQTKNQQQNLTTTQNQLIMFIYSHNTGTIHAD